MSQLKFLADTFVFPYVFRFCFCFFYSKRGGFKDDPAGVLLIKFAGGVGGTSVFWMVETLEEVTSWAWPTDSHNKMIC